ncbi:MAG: aspartate/glutamate racemase family protein, partial [Actinobacteria bacterium]|nr:aspartate/glutamate racemase family protein [Actinomycetota bacterium]
MPRYQTAPGRPAAYGYTIGVLCAEWNIPFVPGDLNNATTFEFPVRYLTVAGARGASVLTGDAPAYAAPF